MADSQTHALMTIAIPPESTLAARLAVNDSALADLVRERIEQVDRHGFSTAHDDDHNPLDLGLAAYAYATVGVDLVGGDRPDNAHHRGEGYWPFMGGFRPAEDARGNLVKAAAILLALIGHLDRARLSATLPADQAA
ncbi:hypothetical protein [Sphingomonas oligoaromativorans]|uniref:hypothetical protein n=1 Tax=Sphingomonas oligoaromativorans TaxID=575322 RepID=UPI001422A6EF|nr:hypothetical protein [Sphingomonas oligoaromativorans]NIJ34315.1 hypothetical protein [Sphingomonas oligoaromativorans]